MVRRPIRRVPERQIADGPVRPLIMQFGLERDEVGFVVERLEAPFRYNMVRVGDDDRPTQCAATGVILDREGVVERTFAVAPAGVAAKQPGLRIMSSKIGVPFELAAALFLGFQHNIGDLARKPGDAEGRGIDDFDPLDARSGSTPKFVDCAARFVGDALAIEQHILGRLA